MVVSCHFAKRDVLCKTTLSRLNAALEKSKNQNTIFLVTGDVPYEPRSKTLAELMRNYLSRAGVNISNIFIGPGVGIFSEARNVTSQIGNSLSLLHDKKVVSFPMPSNFVGRLQLYLSSLDKVKFKYLSPDGKSYF